MPSKRHGYLTRKEWLCARLSYSRNKLRLDRRVSADLERQGYAIQFGKVIPDARGRRMPPPVWLWYNEPLAARTPEQIYADIEALLKTPNWPTGPDPWKNDLAEFARRWGTLWENVDFDIATGKLRE